MRIVLADAGLAFDGLTPAERPLGGAESAFVALAEALASRGETVEARATGARDLTHNGVAWRSLASPWPDAADLYIANRDPQLLRNMPAAGTIAFWLHNPAGFLTKPRYLGPLLKRRPVLVFAGPHHAATAPPLLFGLCKAQIPLGVEQVFIDTPRDAAPPPPRAVFCSNPMRGLAPLARLWAERIHPRAPDAELHVFSGPTVYAEQGSRAAAMRRVLEAVARTPGVVMRNPLPKAALASELATMRALLYLGDPGETYCLAVAEAQAMGVPAVVKPVGAVGERVQDGKTGFVTAYDSTFADAAVSILTKDALFSRLSGNARAKAVESGWDRAAAAFVALAP